MRSQPRELLPRERNIFDGAACRLLVQGSRRCASLACSSSACSAVAGEAGWQHAGIAPRPNASKRHAAGIGLALYAPVLSFDWVLRTEGAGLLRRGARNTRSKKLINGNFDSAIPLSTKRRPTRPTPNHLFRGQKNLQRLRLADFYTLTNHIA